MSQSLYTNLDYFDLPNEIMNEFHSCVSENFDELVELLEHIDLQNYQAAMENLFRHLHSLKGNLAMGYLDPFVNIIHQIEDTVTDIRQGHIQLSAEVLELIDFMLHRTKHYLYEFTENRAIEVVTLDKAYTAIHLLNQSNVEKKVHFAQRILEEYDLTDSPEELLQNVTNQDYDHNNWLELLKKDGIILPTSPLFERYNKSLRWLSDLSHACDTGISHLILKEVVTTHTISLSNIAEQQHYALPYEPNTQTELEHHIHYAAMLCDNTTHSVVANTVLQQHHAYYNGQGIPQLAGESIHIAARMFAIVDTFYYYYKLAASGSHKMDIYKALKTIAVYRNQIFDPKLLEQFIHLCRFYTH